MFKKISPKSKEFFLLFFCAWVFFGLTTNESDLTEYTLSQLGVRAVTEYHTFSLAVKKLPVFDTGYDRFYYKGKILAAKQPGLFVLGSVPYFIMSRFGITYENHYLLASFLVTFFTSSLFSALGVAFLYLFLTSLWGVSRLNAYFTSIVYGAATTILPYSGVAHHDTVAVALIFIAFYLIERNNYFYQNQNKVLSTLSGFLLGVTLFISMLPVFVVLVLLVYILFSKNWKCILFSGIGFLIGIFPLAVYNTYYLGSPAGQAYFEAGYKDAHAIKFNNIWTVLHHIHYYFGLGWLSIHMYMPVAVVSALGLFCMGPKLNKYKILISFIIVTHSFLLVNMETFGHCQYGPRYLIPIIPFMMLGLPFLIDWSKAAGLGKWILLMVMFTAVYSFGINLLGSVYGTMYCGYETDTLAFVSHFRDIWQSHSGSLENWCIFFYSGMLLLWVFWKQFQGKLFSGTDDGKAPLLKSKGKKETSQELPSRDDSHELINPETFHSKSNTKRLFVCIIVLIAVMNIVRFMNLEDSPPGFYIDEAATATSIQCLAEEGTDALGNPYPLFGDTGFGSQRPPILSYFGMVWIKIFGTSIASFRSISAFFAFLTIVGLYFLSSMLLNRRYTIFVMLAASLSPLAFHSSRIAFGLPMSSFFIVWGIYFFLKRGQFLNMFLSGLFFACSMYCYPTTKVQVPLLLFSLFVLKWKYRGLKIKPIIFFFITLVVTSIPLCLATGELQGRFGYLVIFSESFIRRIGSDGSLLSILMMFLKNFALHLNPVFLFLTGDNNLRHSTQFSGELSWLDSFALILGIGYLIQIICEDERVEIRKSKSEITFIIFLIANIIIGIIPSALTDNGGSPHAFRSAGAWPFISLLTGYILWKAAERWKYVLLGIVLISSIFSYKYLYHYFFVYPQMAQRSFDTSIKNAALAVKEETALLTANGKEPAAGPENPWDQFIWQYWDYYPLSNNGLHLRYYLMNDRGETCSESRKDYAAYEKLFFSALTDEELNSRGVILAQRGKLDKATKYFLEATQVNPGNAEAYRNLGAVWSSLGNRQKALDSFTRAYEILSKSPEENPTLMRDMEKLIEKFKPSDADGI